MKAQYGSFRLHAEGGLGKVLIARDEALHRDVAIKELHPCHAQKPSVRKRFLREAQIQAQLEHPGIVPIYEIGRKPQENDPYYAMRFVKGKTFAQGIADYHRKRKQGPKLPLELPRLLSAFVSLCNVIAYAHSKGVVHRDIKPENVILGRFGEVVLLDWGLAKVLHREKNSNDSVIVPASWVSEESGEGGVVGTPAYMAPEQAGVTDCPVGRRADIYGLGGILYEMITGQPPRSRRTFGQLFMRGHDPAVPRVRHIAPRAPAELDAICAKAMAHRVEDRYPDVSELIDDVQCWLADEPVSVFRASAPRRLLRWVRHHRVITTAAFLAFGFLALFAANLLRLTLLERQDLLANELVRELDWGSEALQALRSHFVTVGEVSRDDYRRFVKPYLARERGLQALEWIPVVPGAEREEFERTARAAGVGDFAVTERTVDGELIAATGRATHFPVYYVEPLRGNEDAVGFDLASSYARHQALLTAAECDSPMVSAPVELVQGSAEEPGLLLVCPVFEESAAGAKGELRGFTLAVYRIDRLVTDAWEGISMEHLVVRLYDVTDRDHPYLLWCNEEEERGGFVAAAEIAMPGLFWSVSREIEVAGRTWQVATTAKPSFLLYYPASR